MSTYPTICCIFVLLCIISGTTNVDVGDQFDTAPTTYRPTLWTNGVVPYLISSDYSAPERKVILAAMNEFHRLTCIRLIPRTDQHHFIIIKPKQGCSSHIGRRGGPQYLSLVGSCLTKKTIINKIMQTLGYSHDGRYKRQIAEIRHGFFIDASKLNPYAIPNHHSLVVRNGFSFADEMAINKMYDCPQQHPDESIDHSDWIRPGLLDLNGLA